MALKPIRSVRFLTDYEDQSTDLVIPEDLTTLGEDELAALSAQATEAFNTIYDGGNATLSEEDLATLSTLADGIEALRAETETRDGAAAERAARAAELAATVTPEAPADEDEADEAEDEADEAEDEADEAEDEADEADSVTASGRREIRVNTSRLRSRRPAQPEPDQSGPMTIRDIAFATTEAGGQAVGAAMDFHDMGEVVDRRLTTFNLDQFRRAAKSGRRIKQQFGIATITKPHGEEMTIRRGASSDEIERVLTAATDQSRLEGGSLTASGGWCAPSEIIYDIYDCGEVADSLLSIPSVGMPRGGIQFNKGVGFNDLLTQTGFFYTEQQDIDGNYGVDEDGVGDGTEGSKPCFKIPCIDFDEVRLDLDGLCLQAGLLQARGYPEVIADTIRKALIAHEIRMDSRTIAEIVAGSTAISLPSPQVGAAAPILTAVELQAQHYRSSGSLGDNTVLEGIFPIWTRGAIRSDLSRRLGVEMLNVTDQMINQWFTTRKIAPQFVANWQNVGTTAASGFTAWPTEVDFLLYKAGTWVKGTSDVITLENIYDSTLLGQNDYTALFTEEGIATFMRGCDSRVVTVPICPSGETGAGVGIDCDGTEAA